MGSEYMWKGRKGNSAQAHCSFKNAHVNLTL